MRLARWLGVCLGVFWILSSGSLRADSPQHQSTATAAVPLLLPPSSSGLPDPTNSPGQTSTPAPLAVEEKAAVPAPGPVAQSSAEPPALPQKALSLDELQIHLTNQLATARQLRLARKLSEAESLLTGLMSDPSPEWIQQSALLELAALAEDAHELSRAQQIYAQFLGKWPNDLRRPEVLLQQGLLFRRMGLNDLALTKLYGVMTSALVLKNDQLDYYARLVLRAQTEIAETQYELGKYPDAAEFFSRLLKLNNPAINTAQVLFKLTRCHAASGQYTDVVSEAQEFLTRYPGASEQAEVRFHLAQALKELGRSHESLQQVLRLLQEQRTHTREHPEIWTYWQQRAGNLIANQLYGEGDYAKALEIYLNLAQLDASPQWRLPVQYQIGMTHERLWQLQKAADIYQDILTREKELGADAPPHLKSLFEMARWRLSFIQWQSQAETALHQFHPHHPTNTSVAASLTAAPIAIP
jgi:tetratricopeptide (TPR) repeat protein